MGGRPCDRTLPDCHFTCSQLFKQAGDDKRFSEFHLGSGYTIHFSGALEFKYWISDKEYKLAYHVFNDALFPVPEEYWI